MNDWLAWQLVDSAFPTGAFAHSLGLESACQHGEVTDAGQLRTFVDASILQAGFAALPFVNAAFHDPDTLQMLDDMAEAFLTNPVANRASRVQGRTLLATTARIWPSPGVDSLKERADGTCAHVAPLSGAAFRLVGLPLGVTQRVLLYGTSRSVLSAAVRLGIVGSYEAQRMQYACAEQLDQVAARCAALTLDDLGQTAPLLDLLQSGHDQLYSRLFQS